MRYVVVVLVVATVLLLAALILTDEPRAGNAAGTVPCVDGGDPVDDLQITDEKVGDGPAAKAGDRVSVQYAGTFKDGKQFDSGQYDFTLGAGEVIPGWDQGIVGMKVGGKRKLVVPHRLAYGERGRSGIPPKSELTFAVELVAIK